MRFLSMCLPIKKDGELSFPVSSNKDLGNDDLFGALQIIEVK
jgi:hypothetical protein